MGVCVCGIRSDPGRVWLQKTITCALRAAVARGPLFHTCTHARTCAQTHTHSLRHVRAPFSTGKHWRPRGEPCCHLHPPLQPALHQNWLTLAPSCDSELQYAGDWQPGTGCYFRWFSLLLRLLLEADLSLSRHDSEQLFSRKGVTLRGACHQCVLHAIPCSRAAMNNVTADFPANLRHSGNDSMQTPTDGGHRKIATETLSEWVLW